MWEYSDKVKDHFMNPRNVGSIENPEAVGEVGSLACGDALRLSLRIGEGDRILDARFQTFGCGSAIASSSALTEMVKGLTLDEALRITNKDIADYLGGLPREKMHCSVMGREALEAAIANYRGLGGPARELEGELVCECFGVTDVQIRRAIEENRLSSVEDVTHFTKAGGGCGKCLPKIKAILDEALGAREAAAPAPAPEIPRKMTNIKRIQLIQKVIDEEIRPRLQADGGDLELADVDGTTAFVSLRGKCTHCAASELTIKTVVEPRLRELVDPDIKVVEVP